MEIIKIEPNQEQTQLIPLSEINAKDIFVKGLGLDHLLLGIREEAFKVKQDVSTKDSREAFKSNAYLISRSKTFLDDIGKQVVADQKKEVDSANANRKKIRETLDALRTEYRQPLTDYENEEKRKEEEEKKKEREKIDNRIASLAELSVTLPYAQIATMTDEEFDELYQKEKDRFEKQEKSNQREIELKTLNVFRSGIDGECLISIHEDFVYSGKDVSWDDILEMSDKEFIVFMNDLKNQLKVHAEKKAKEKAEEEERINKEKESLRNQRKEIRTHILKETGFIFENDYFTLNLSASGSQIILTLNEVADYEPEDFTNALYSWKALIKADEELSMRPQETEPEEAPEEVEEDKTEAEEEVATAESPSVAIDSSKIEADKESIRQWLNSIKDAIDTSMPVSFNTHKYKNTAIDIKDTFYHMLDKVIETWLN